MTDKDRTEITIDSLQIIYVTPRTQEQTIAIWQKHAGGCIEVCKYSLAEYEHELKEHIQNPPKYYASSVLSLDSEMVQLGKNALNTWIKKADSLQFISKAADTTGVHAWIVRTTFNVKRKSNIKKLEGTYIVSTDYKACDSTLVRLE